MSTTKSSRRKSPQHIFKLSGVNPEEIDKQYFKLHKIEKLTQLNNTSSLSEKFIPHQSTKISELQTFNANQNITVVDELKNTHNAKVSTVAGDVSRLCCFWDRHPIPNDKVIYCPVEKIQSPQIKSYTSYINGKPYKIQDSINLKTEYEHYYVDGVFCSIECCLALSKKLNPIHYTNTLNTTFETFFHSLIKNVHLTGDSFKATVEICPLKNFASPLPIPSTPLTALFTTPFVFYTGRIITCKVHTVYTLFTYL